MIGILCGMASERAALGAWAGHGRVLTAVSGARPEEATRGARRLAAAGATLLVSFGVAGGLAPGLRPGDLLAPSRLIDEPERTADAAAAARPLARELIADLAGEIGARDGVLIGVDAVIAGVADKAHLHGLGADAVDMESHRLVRAAAAAGIPALALRAVADPADRALPSAALGGLGPDGRPRVLPVLAGLARRPGQLPALLAVKSDVDAGLAALRRAAERAMPRLLEIAAERPAARAEA